MQDGRLLGQQPDTGGASIRFECLTDVVRVLTAAESFEDAASAVLEAVRKGLMADVALLWLREDESDVFRLATMSADVSVGLHEFREECSRVEFRPGVGLPGQLCTTRQPLWLEDLPGDRDLPHAYAAAEAGLDAAGAFPILRGDDVIGVIEVLCGSPLPRDEAALQMMAGIASLIEQSLRYERGVSNIGRAESELRVLTDDDAVRTPLEASTRGAEALFAPFMQHLPGAAWIKNAVGRYEYANELAQRIFGLPIEELRGKSDFEVFPAETARQFRENDRKALRERKRVQTIEQLEHDDGVVHESVVSKFPIFDADGNVICVGGVAFDVTEWKLIEEALRESEQRNRATFNSPAVGICEVDLAGQFLRVNDAFCRITGYSEKELTGLRYQHITHPDDVTADTEQYRRLQAGEIDRYSLEKRYIRRDGRTVWVALNVSLVRDARGRPTYGIGIVVDVTQRRMADAAKASLAAIVESSDDAIIGKTLDGIITSWNRGAERLYGYMANEMIGASVARIIPDENAHELPEILARLRRGESIPSFETRRRRKDGRIIDVSLAVSPIHDFQGRIIGASAIARDIMEWNRTREALRQSEERLRFTLEAAQVGAWDWNIQTGEVKWSDNLEAIHDRAAGTFGGTFEDVIREVFPPDREKLRSTIEEALAGEGDYEVEYRIIRADGSVGWLHGQGRAVFDDAGRPVRMAGVCMDVTERRQAEIRLLEAREAAEAANRSKSEFLANISHEIRTPMSAILGYADMIGQNLTDAGLLEHVDVIRRNGNFLLEIINDVLDLSRIEAGRLEIERERFRPDELLCDVRALMEVRAREKQLPLQLEFDGPIPETIESDPTRLRQILINLVGNAIKFTESGEVRVAVRLLRAEQLLLIDVVDTGIGIREEQIERLFEPFTQADSSVSRQYGGSGVGLAISKRLTTLLGGEITVRSQPGRGSVFSITVGTGPLDGTPLITARQKQSPPAGGDRVHGVRLDCRVLIVDDQRDLRHLLARCVEDAGGEVEIAENGREALSIVERCREAGRPIDVVLLDMQMPVMDGYEAAAQLRARGFSGRIIALTANAMQGDSEKCLQSGCDDYISKPVDRRELIEAIHIQIQRPDGSNIPPHRSRVLLVEDNANVSRMMQMLLESRGYSVCVAGNGSSAVSAAADFRPDVVLLDLGLPDISGYEVLAQLQQQQLNGCTIIALSGSGEPEDKQRSQQAGFHHHFVKPASIDELEIVISECVNST